MTVPVTPNKFQHIGNGVTTVFPFGFRLINAAHLRVIQTDTDGTETTLALGTHFTLSGVGSYSGGAVTLNAPLSDGYRLTLKNLIPIEQATKFRGQGSFFAESHEDAFDKLTLIAKQLQEQISRIVTLPPGSDENASAELPTPSEGSILGWVNGSLRNLASASASLAANLLSNSSDLGDALILVKQPYAGAVEQSQDKKNQETISTRDFGAVENGITDDLVAVNRAVAAAITNGSRTVHLHGVNFVSGAVTNHDQVTFVGHGGSFQPGISYKVNQIGAIGGKKGKHYSVYAGIPRCGDVAVISLTRTGSTAHVTVASTAGMNVHNYVTISGADQEDYNHTLYPSNITATTFDLVGVPNSPVTPATGTLRAHWWAMIEDANHEACGFLHLETPDVNTLQITYDADNGFYSKKIGHLTCGVDETFAPCGMIAGASVGPGLALITMAVPLSCSFSGGGGVVTHTPVFVDLPPLLHSSLTVTKGSDGERVVTHPPVQAGDVPVVSVKYPAYAGAGGHMPKDIQVEWTSTAVYIWALSAVAGHIKWDAGAGAFVQVNSDNLGVPTFTWGVAGAGILRVTIPTWAIMDDITPPYITAHGGTYVVQTEGIGNGYFDVCFYDYAGTRYTGAPNANMKFSYGFSNAKTVVEWPEDMVVTVRRGMVTPRTDDCWRLAGANLWISALMENE